jgi:hypothetical protein
VTDPERMVWAARFAKAVADGSKAPALAASLAVDELRKASLEGFLQNASEVRTAKKRLAEMQRKELG